MAERAPRHEQDGGSTHELSNQRREAERQSQEKARTSRHEHAEKLEDIRSTAEREAASSEETIQEKLKAESSESDQSLYVNRELKDMAYARTLKRARSRLPAPARAFSKVVHQPVVEAVSEVAGKTVARPSGVLAGGIVAFIGSSGFLWISKHYGYEYNFLLFALLFVGGFFIGLLIELLIRLVRKRNS